MDCISCFSDSLNKSSEAERISMENRKYLSFHDRALQQLIKSAKLCCQETEIKIMYFFYGKKINSGFVL